MEGYLSIDPIISNWISKNKLHLFTGANNDRRYAHISSSSGYCLQISIHPVLEGHVGIIVWQLEPDNDGFPVFEVNSDIEHLSFDLDKLFTKTLPDIFAGLR